MIKKFLIFPNKNQEGNKPDYIIKGQDGQEMTELGGAWKKTWEKNGKSGSYLSASLKNEFTKEDGEKLHGYVLITEEEYNVLKTKEPIAPEDSPF